MDSLASTAFIDVSKIRKSEVWRYFLFSEVLQRSKCKECESVFKLSGTSTTSAMVRHLRGMISSF